MKCSSCNKRNGSIRCEGCDTLFCWPCMNAHHDRLGKEFDLLIDVRNEVKQSLEISASTNSNRKKTACLMEIDAWEREIIQHIQRAAENARMNVNELMRQHMKDNSNRLEQISVQIQEGQKQRDYSENDIERIRDQLDQLKKDIKHVTETIQVDSSLSNNIVWDTLIYVVEDEGRLSITSSAHKTGKGTAKGKKSIVVSNSNKPKHAHDSSRSVSPIERSTTERLQLNSRPAQVISSSSSSKNSHVNFYEQRPVSPGSCVVCHKPFNNPGLMLICSDCEHEQGHPTSNGNRSSRPRTTRSQSINPYLSTSDRDNASIMSSTTKALPPRKIRCPHCNRLTLFDNLIHEKEYHCGSCQNLIPAAYLT